ncbi:MAG: hypothetical protein ACR2MA_05575 [Egibacteraceae bacterium]
MRRATVPTGSVRPEHVCYAVGTVLILIGLAHLAGFLVFGGAWVGPVTWRKPFAFGVSFGITTATLGWISTQVRLSTRRAWRLALLLVAANTYEVIWVSVQRARGVPSHFARTSTLDAALFGIAGMAIAATVLVIVALTILSFRWPLAPPEMRLALRVGLLILLASMATGGAMIRHGIAAVAAGEIELTTWGAAGVMKLPHAVGMHAIQVLPALAWLARRTRLDARRRLRAVSLACWGYAGLTAVSLLQTFGGLAPWDLRASSAVLLLASLTLLAWPAFRVGAGLRQRA